MRRHMKRTLLSGLAWACVACGGASPPPKLKPQPLTVAPAPVAAPPRKFTFSGAPDTPAGDQLAWLLDALVNRHGKIDRAELAAHFSPSFFEQVPADKLVGIFAEIAGQVPGLTLNTVESAADRLTAHAVVGPTKLGIALVIDANQLISALSINPEEEPGAKPTSYEDAIHLASSLAPKAQLLVASLDKGACRPLQELAADDELALGSSFKLYVLLALADQVVAGKLHWTDELAVRDDWKSLPSGTTQNERPGTKLKLLDLATRMISLSDNTAADHLLYTLGRKQVEAALRTAKHAKPALDTPFLSTRELFLFKLATPDAELERYLKLPEARRRDYLDKALAGKPPRVDKIADWTAARRIDKLEWFASANDMCRVMGALWTRAQDDKAHAVLDVLAKNPGLPIDKKVWPYIGFKGGSEPGVLNMTYLLRRADDRWFVIVLGFNAAEGGTIPDDKVYSLATGLIELVGQTR
jgi:beta-lactamase class A